MKDYKIYIHLKNMYQNFSTNSLGNIMGSMVICEVWYNKG